MNTAGMRDIYDEIADTVAVSVAEVTPDTILDSLGFEEIDFLDLTFRLERLFDIKLERSNLETCVTVSDVIDYIDRVCN